MSRAEITYGERREYRATAGIDVTVPQAGFFRMRLRAGGVMCGVQILHGPPLDPVTGEIMDRSHRWQAFVNGRYFDQFDRIWPVCAGEPISETEYRRYCARLRWAEEHAPDSAYADHTRKRDPLSINEPLPF